MASEDVILGSYSATTTGSQESGKTLIMMFLKSSSGMLAPKALVFDHLLCMSVIKLVKSVQSMYVVLLKFCSALRCVIFDAFSKVSMYDVQASAAVPSMFIPSPTGFFVLKMSKPSAQASRTIHSLIDGFVESYGVSGGSAVVGSGAGDVIGEVSISKVVGRLIVPSI